MSVQHKRLKEEPLPLSIINPVYDDDISTEANIPSNGANNNSKSSPAGNGDVRVEITDKLGDSPNAASTNSTNANGAATETVWSNDKKKLLESTPSCVQGWNKKRCIIAAVIALALCLIIFLIVYFVATSLHSSHSSIPGKQGANIDVKGPQYDVRLGDKDHGLVQYYSGNHWLILCIDSWSTNSADVVCHQLGYSNAVSWKLQKISPKNTYMYNSRMLNCTGKESALSSCPIKMSLHKLGQCPGSALFVDCGTNVTSTLSPLSTVSTVSTIYTASGTSKIAENVSSTFAAVPTLPATTSTIPTTPSVPSFIPLDLMINGSLNGLKNEGRLLVKHNHLWGTICNELWSSKEALVVCRQLGYSNYSESSIHHFISRVAPAHPQQVVWMTDVKCYGNETNLGQCEFNGWNITKPECSHAFDVILSCLPDEPTTVALRSSTTESATTTSATTMLTPESTTFHAVVTTSAVPTTVLSTTTTAFPIPTEALVSLQFGQQPNEGLLVITINGVNYTACDDFWNEQSASVVCRMNGYSEVIDKQDTFLLEEDEDYMTSEFEIFPSKIECAGNEAKLSECAFSSMHTCLHSDDVKLVCGPVPTTLPPTTRTSATTIRTSTTIASTALTSPLMSSEVHSTSTISTPQPSTIMPDDRFIKERVPIRLKGGRDNEGLLQVFFNGTWGTVCNSRWSETNAEVVCRQKHYPGVEVADIFMQRPEEGIMRGQDSDVIWLASVECDGTEEYLTACKHIQADEHCNHFRDVMMRCEPNGTGTTTTQAPVSYKNGDIRLNGEESRGGLEYYWDGEWGNVCNSGWNEEAAIVACRQLGYNNVSIHELPDSEHSDSLPYLISDVVCQGTEETLSECNYKNGSQIKACYDSYTGLSLFDKGARIGIACDPYSKVDSSDAEDEIRLVHGVNASNIGMLQYKLNNKWGSLCRRSWTYRSAEVACTQLGFPGVQVYNLSVTQVVGLSQSDFSTPFHGEGYQCTDQHEKIADCPSLLVTTGSDCTKEEDEVAVVCQPRENITSLPTAQSPLNFTADDSVRLVGGITKYEGRVEFLINGTWGRVCDKNGTWTHTNMEFVCETLFRKSYSMEFPAYLLSLTGNGTFIAGEFDCNEYQPTTDSDFRLSECSYESDEEYLRDCITDARVKCV